MEFIHQSVPFDQLGGADLVLDAAYSGGEQPNVGADPIARLLPVGNQGGFRYQGQRALGSCRLAVLFTTGESPDWPDYLDPQTGRFIYFGDNRTKGRRLHDTPRGGNQFLREVFEALHAVPSRRELIPPFLLFEKSGQGRDVVFRGIAAPGSPEMTPMEDLVAVWKTTRGQRFQNYRAAFTMLDCDVASRAWLDSIAAGDPLGRGCPEAWKTWVRTGRYSVLRAQRTLEYRSKAEQLPATAEGLRIISDTHAYFQSNPHGFEYCAAKLWRMLAPRSTLIDVTRPSRDGGRDAIGLYSIGPPTDPISIDFAIEAKCYALGTPATVRDTARLISRLRHRQFGVFVTTSYVGQQAYEELRQDRHPVAVVAARDIVEILRLHQRTTPAAVAEWLKMEFPQ